MGDISICLVASEFTPFSALFTAVKQQVAQRDFYYYKLLLKKMSGDE